MVRRILVALSDVSGIGPLYRCVAALPCSRTADVTVVTTISTSAWTSGLPDVISAGTAARLLEIRPWETAADSVAQMVHAFSERCAAGGVRCRVEAPETNPIDSVVRACRSHDLLIAGLPPLTDPQGESILERAIDCSGIPVLRAGSEVDAVSRVLVLLSDDAAGFRSLRAFISLHLWPAATTTVAAVGLESDVAECAASWCADHGIAAKPLRREFRSRAEVLAWSRTQRMDVIVTGWAGSPPFRTNDEAAPVLLMVK